MLKWPICIITRKRNLCIEEIAELARTNNSLLAQYSEKSVKIKKWFPNFQFMLSDTNGNINITTCMIRSHSFGYILHYFNNNKNTEAYITLLKTAFSYFKSLNFEIKYFIFSITILVFTPPRWLSRVLKFKTFEYNNLRFSQSTTPLGEGCEWLSL